MSAALDHLERGQQTTKPDLRVGGRDRRCLPLGRSLTLPPDVEIFILQLPADCPGPHMKDLENENATKIPRGRWHSHLGCSRQPNGTTSNHSSFIVSRLRPRVWDGSCHARAFWQKEKANAGCEPDQTCTS